ncbi:MAG: tetratricopeptide repeat protein, partial [Kiritimatiellae bacterium]|nr:tetratricopeptide repeat protein [Kiritimatiellia bacterium]
GTVQKCPASAKVLPRVRLEQASALSSLGKYSAAIVILDEVINKYPASDMVLRSWLRKGDCQFMLGGVDKRRYEEAIKSFRVVVNNSDAGFENVLEAEYKIGKCKEMLGKIDQALEHYHSKVMVKCLDDIKKGIKRSEASKIWFTRASFSVADMLAARNEWRKVVNVLQRLADADVPASDKARERIKDIKSKRWWRIR